MKSDTIHVASSGKGLSEALEQADKVAVFKSLDDKSSLHLRLLTEEMMGMMRALNGEKEGEFWIDDEGGVFALHLKAKTAMNSALRSDLLEVSKSGKNAAAKGVTGKLRDLFERFMEPQCVGEGEVIPLMDHTFASAEFGVLPMPGADQWSLRSYKQAAEDGRAPKEAWDELEKSVIAKLADDVLIGIAGSHVEMTVIKKF